MSVLRDTDRDRDRYDDDDDEVTFYEESEARRSLGTSEFWIYVIVTALLLFFTYQDGGDSLSREDGWRYAAATTVGYFISRGLAKAGSSEPRVRQRKF
jgi:hypothetical protein